MTIHVVLLFLAEVELHFVLDSYEEAEVHDLDDLTLEDVTDFAFFLRLLLHSSRRATAVTPISSIGRPGTSSAASSVVSFLRTAMAASSVVFSTAAGVRRGATAAAASSFWRG